MPAARHSCRVDTFGTKTQIERKIGRVKAEKYFNLLTSFLSLKISKSEFDKLCIGTIGKENVCLHNYFLKSIIKNASIAKPPLSKVEGARSVTVANGSQRSSIQSLCKYIPQSPRKGRTPNLHDRKFRDRPSPLGPHGKNHSIAFEDSVPKIQEQQTATELLSLGSRPPGSVEDGEEVDQATRSPRIYNRSPVRAPLGIPINTSGTQKILRNRLGAYSADTCLNSGGLPDTGSLRNRLQQKLEMEGLNISVDCANLLNNGLDVFLKNLLKPCLEIACSRSGNENINHRHTCATPGLNGTWPVRYGQKRSRPVSASMSDFRVAMELNPLKLGEDWPIQLEKVCLRESEGTD